MDFPAISIADEKYLILFVQFLLLRLLADYSKDKGREDGFFVYTVVQILVVLLALFGK